METKERIEKALKEFGNYNSLPKPYKILDQRDFYYQQNHLTVYETEHRQIIDEQFGKQCRNTIIYWGFDNGLAIVFPNDWKIVDDHAEYKDLPTFLLIGCDHDYKQSANLGNCYNRYECTKCGFTKDVDSSD